MSGARPSDRLNRRTFLVDLGRATLAMTMVGGVLAACRNPAAGDVPTPPARTTDPEGPGYGRIDLGFVSAYVLVRAGEGAVVDTGVAGSVSDIEEGLRAVELGWDSVGHVVLTHKHPDHAGSLAAVLERAAEAAGYAGEADIPHIASPRPLRAVGDGDRVFDLEVVATPGHTPGHICLLDRGAGLLLAGDALNGADGGVVGPNPQFTEDMAEAERSVRKLAGLEFDTVLFGHGEPVEGEASRAVAELAARL